MTKIKITQTHLRDSPFHGRSANGLFLSLEHSGFGFVSDLDIRISDFFLLQALVAAGPQNYDRTQRIKPVTVSYRKGHQAGLRIY